MKRDILVMVTRAPFGRIHVAEGLRAAHGVAAGFDRHDVTVLFTGDGVYAAREAIDREALDVAGYFEELPGGNGRLVADRHALDRRDVAPAEVAGDVDVVSNERVAELVRGADHTLDF